tara:strand:+ start:554 stop:913 length:360 start_codon:yes stop_codon:yes gene_type:complete
VRFHLYNRPGSGGFVVEAALVLAGANFELTEMASKPGTPLPESFRNINPWGQMPTLALSDRTTMTETAAILLHLTGCFTDVKMAPTPETTALTTPAKSPELVNEVLRERLHIAARNSQY